MFRLFSNMNTARYFDNCQLLLATRKLFIKKVSADGGYLFQQILAIQLFFANNLQEKNTSLRMSQQILIYRISIHWSPPRF